MTYYENKVCIVTGATSGIGKAITDLLIRAGAIVILVVRDNKLLSEQPKLLGENAESKVCDVTDLSQVEELVEYTLNKYKKIDYIFNNAGIIIVGEARDITIDDWNKVLDVNLKGVINGVVATYPLMVKQGFGHIVNTSSMAGLTPGIIQLPYITSKFAVVGLSHSLRMEGKELGVKVSVVCPGPVDTAIWTDSKVVGSKAKNPLTFLSLGWSPKLIASHKAAKIILRGVQKNKATILTDFSSQLGWYCYRLLPNLWMWLYEIYTMKKVRKIRVEHK